MTNKFAHVKRDTVPAKDCAWPDCKTAIPKSHAMCEPHWMMLPKNLRDRIWALYMVGQEDDQDLVTNAYLDALSAARDWAAKYEAMFKARQPAR